MLSIRHEGLKFSIYNFSKNLNFFKFSNLKTSQKGTLTNHGRQEQVAVKTLKVLDDNGAFEEFMKEGILTKGKSDNLLPLHKLIFTFCFSYVIIN